MITIDLSGIKQLRKAIDQIEHNATDVIADEIKASTLQIAKEAKRSAPSNLGTLRQSIQTQGSGLSYETFSTVSYAPYVEFGTGGKVSVPAGWGEFAMQYKGKKGGTMYDFFLAILQWIKRKGIKAGIYSVKTKRRLGGKAQRFDEDVRLANAIAYSILKKGISPQPFMIPSYEKEKPKLLRRLKKLFS